MLKFDVWMSLSVAPAFLSAARTAATRRLFSFTASSTVGPEVCTPSVKLKRSGVTLERPVPETVMVSGIIPSRGGTVCANALDARPSAMTVVRNLFMVPPRFQCRPQQYARQKRLLTQPMADPNDKVPGQALGRYYVDTQCIDCDLCRETSPAN